MTAPWEKYAAAPTAKEIEPWAKYSEPTQKPAAKPAEYDYAGEARKDIEAARQERLAASNKDGRAAAGAAVAGGSLGISDIGNVALNAMSYIPGKLTDAIRSTLPAEHKKRVPDISQMTRTRNADFEDIAGRHVGQPAFSGFRTAGNIATTLPVGGALGGGVRAAAPALVRAGASAPVVNGLATALETGGFRAGTGVGAGTNIALRASGGAISGGAALGATNPDNFLTGTAIGGMLPLGLLGAAKGAGWAGRSVNSMVQPFTAKGQEAIAGGILRKFADGGPTTINASQLVPGSIPTLAEATGNAGLAGLQRGARDLKPNSFVAREEANAAARNAAFGEAAGDVGKLDFFKAERAAVGKQLYDDALDVVPAPPTPYLKGQVTQLLKRPSINEASKKAQQWAIERGEKPYLNGSMRGLHDTKTALDDMINEAVMKGQGGHAKALEATQAKLLDVMEKMSPGYKEARITYAKMSQPVNAMEALQGLKLTDAKGNITLQKVKTAIEGLERAQNGAGISAAKSVDVEQMRVLKAIQADLLRQNALGAGRSAGANTFQNIATDNMLATMLPGKLGQMATGKVGGVLGQVGKLAYSGPNDAIRNKLAEMMLEPAMARSAFQPATPLLGPAGAKFNALLDRYAPAAYRAAPLLKSDR